MIVPATESLTPRAIARDVEHAVRGYLEARTVEEKLAFVRRSPEVRFLMQDYVLRRPLEPCEVLQVDVIAACDSLVRMHPLYLAAATTAEDELIPLMIEVRNGNYLVDWESHVGYSPMELDAFLRTPAESSIWFRVHASRSTYHNYHFNDPADTVPLRLSVPGSQSYCYGYLSRHHSQFSEFNRLLAGKTDVPMIITLIQKSPVSGARRQVEIGRLIQPSWFIEDASKFGTEAWLRPPLLTGDR